MAEFNNRIAAQRYILTLVNSVRWKEELFGLSEKSIERWIISNQLDQSSRLVILVYQAAEKLFFLANKSQEQISEEYELVTQEIAFIAKNIAAEIS